MICETPSSETVIAPELWICAPSRALTVVPGDERIDHDVSMRPAAPCVRWGGR